MMFHGNLSRVFHLIQILLIQLRQSGGSHGAGGADLCLAAAFRTGDGGVALGKAADDSGSCKPTKNLLVCKALCLLGIFQNCWDNTAGSAGRCGDNGAVICVLLSNSLGIGGDSLKFQKGRSMVFCFLLIQVFRFALNLETTGQNAGR